MKDREMIWLAMISCVSGALCFLVSFAEAGTRIPEPRYKPPGILVSFQGGLAARNIFDVLAAVEKAGIILPTEEIEVREGDSICKLLVARNFPPECDRLLKLVDSLNPNTRLMQRILQVGEKFNFPKLQISRYRSINNYPESVPTQVDMGRRISRNYADISKSFPKNLENYKAQNLDREGFISIEYWSYEIYIPVASEQIVNEITSKIYELHLGNVYVDPVIRGGPPANLNAQSIEDTRDLCSRNKISEKPYFYADLLENDSTAVAVVAKKPSDVPRDVSVTLIDVEIAKAPNLWPAFGDQEPNLRDWTCKWSAFNKDKHHATHLASIIASRNTFGFEGISRNAKLEGFLWWKLNGDKSEKSTADRARSLADYFVERNEEYPLPIYLAATEFDKFGPEQAPPIRLDRPEQRFNRLTGNIQRFGPLLIVAAGQNKDANIEGEEIELRSNLSPQNLGDLHNVIVVTACEVCEQGAQKLLPSANYSRKGEFLVHVAAPGGAQMPGWISAGEIGAARGTSQAAAYVAGVAAAMIGYFPETYKTPVAVKTRLQATSRPLSLKGDGFNPDSEKLSAGVVDAQLALLDPKKTWVKDGKEWRSINVKKDWPKFVFTAESGAQELIDGDHILRFVKVLSPSADTSWVVYTDRVKINPINIGGSVARTELVAPDPDAFLTLCDGTKISLSKIDDLIPRMGVGGDACAVGSRPLPHRSDS